MKQRSRLKGVAERSESSNKMIAGGNHTAAIASSKCIPLKNPPAATMKVLLKDEHSYLLLCSWGV
jgi:hypothetical protein